MMRPLLEMICETSNQIMCIGIFIYYESISNVIYLVYVYIYITSHISYHIYYTLYYTYIVFCVYICIYAFTIIGFYPNTSWRESEIAGIKNMIIHCQARKAVQSTPKMAIWARENAAPLWDNHLYIYIYIYICYTYIIDINIQYLYTLRSIIIYIYT